VTTGQLTWDGPESFTTADGSESTVSFADLSGFKVGNAVSDAMTITVDRIGAAVPEPATWALMIGGFGLMGAALRRQRQGRAFAA
jgi:hypothetical protein